MRLAAAGGKLRDVINAPLPAKDRTRYEQSLGAVRTLLNQEEFAKAWAESRSLSMEEAVKRALNGMIP